MHMLCGGASMHMRFGGASMHNAVWISEYAYVMWMIEYAYTVGFSKHPCGYQVCAVDTGMRYHYRDFGCAMPMST